MSAHSLRATPVAGTAVPTPDAICRRFLDALDAFVTRKACNAVPEHELHRAECEIDRYRRLMHAGPNPAVKAAPSN
jgi:hypothetical protein